MAEMLSELNQSTQPIREYPVFNNWDFVAKGWYALCKSSELKPGKARSQLICGHKVAIFRTESGKLGAMDAFCPHMGMDMGSGKVVGETLQCFFHHWRFNTQGKCVDIPCSKSAPNERAHTQSYPVEEKYGWIWIYSDRTAPGPVFEADELKGQEIMYTSLAPFRRIAHPHITMMNSIDGQHMRTVHKLDIDLAEMKVEENGNRFKTSFFGHVKTNTWVGRLQRIILEDTYRSSVTFIDGCLGLLTTMIDVKLFGRYPLPRFYYLFSQTFTEKGKTVVIPIIILKRMGKGPVGYAMTWLLLMLNKVTMKFLAWQDGRMIYHQIRFRQDGLLAEYDAPTAKWIAYVNRAVKPSIWSKGPLSSFTRLASAAGIRHEIEQFDGVPSVEPNDTLQQ